MLLKKADTGFPQCPWQLGLKEERGAWSDKSWQKNECSLKSRPTANKYLKSKDSEN